MATKMGVLEIMQRHYQQRDLAAREWRDGGGKVAGYFCDNVPDEMILVCLIVSRFCGPAPPPVSELFSFS